MAGTMVDSSIPDKICSTGRKKRNKSSRKGGESWGKGGNGKSSEASIITEKRGCGWTERSWWRE